MTAAEVQVAFVVANDRHHTAGALPVIDALKASAAIKCGVLSLCEFRGFEAPVERFRRHGVPVSSVVPFRFRRPSTGRGDSAGAASASRRFARAIFWRFLLVPGLKRALGTPPRLVVLPNDGAYPYDRICRHLARRGVPFVIQQEGIRFTTPGETNEGRSEAAAWAVWGETSAEYFRALGAPASSVRITGAPRFDEIFDNRTTRQAEELATKLTDGRPFLALLSNPIDDLGLVTNAQKLALTREVVSGILPLLEQKDWRLVIKLHGRESAADVESALSGVAHGAQVNVVSDCPLYPLLRTARGALTFASSVGLEALLFRVPLAVVEIPGHGFVHDFVSSGVATGLEPRGSLAAQVEEWLEANESRQQRIREYLDRTVAFRGDSAAEVASLIRSLLSSDRREAG